MGPAELPGAQLPSASSSSHCPEDGLHAADSPQPLPVPRGTSWSAFFYILAPTLGKYTIHNSLQPSCTSCALTLAGLASRCVHVFPLPSNSSSQPDCALLKLTHSHTHTHSTWHTAAPTVKVKSTHWKKTDPNSNPSSVSLTC